MRVLIACEFSGVARDAFRQRGHEAWSCDLLPAEPSPHSSYHFRGDVTPILGQSWDLIIAHPPCTDLAVSGARHFPAKRADGRQQRAIDFFMQFTQTACRRFCIENPVSIISSVWRKPDQIVQPWMFGHPETKATCLWLNELPLLQPTNDVRHIMETLPAKDRSRIHYMSPGPNRGKLRSITFQGIAEAMAAQWG